MNSFVRLSVPALVLLTAACGSSGGGSGAAGGAGGSDSSGGEAGSAVGGESGVGGEDSAGSAGDSSGGVGGESGAGAAGTSGGGGSGQGNAGAAGSTGGTSSAPMLTCSADITADTSNVGVMHFEVNTAGGVVLPQGTALPGKDAQHTQFGLSALQSPGNLLQIALVGPAATTGATYKTAADLGESINGVANYLGFSVTGSGTSSWVADAGTVVTTAAVGPGPLANYKIIQFTFSGAHMTPSMRSNDKATGAFTLSGSCTGAIQYK